MQYCGHVTRCNVSYNAISTQAAQNITACNTNFRARLYYLQRLQRISETIASCNPRLQRVFVLLETLQVAATCNMSLTTCNGFFSIGARQVARKIALCNTSLKPGLHIVVTTAEGACDHVSKRNS